ncbi:hypothetical protein Tco_0228084 [Tanacetum coccineum]
MFRETPQEKRCSWEMYEDKQRRAFSILVKANPTRQDATNQAQEKCAVLDEEQSLFLRQENRDVSSVRNDALMSILDEMHEQGVQSRLANKSHMVVNDSVTSELARYKELDQSVQTVHMLCQPKSFYDEKHKVAIGYKNPLCLARAKQAQSALYNGHVLVTTNHAPTIIHDSEDNTAELS